MSIKTRNSDPKITEFSKKEIIINTREGSLFFKSEKGLHKLNDRNLQPPQTHYQLHTFANHWQAETNTRFIDWGTKFDNNTLLTPNQLLIPFGGTIHKLFFKQVGTTPTTTIRLYKNIRGQNVALGTHDKSPIKTIIHTNEIGVHISTLNQRVGLMNTVVLDEKVNAGDHIAISMQASSDGIYGIFGQLLTSQPITL